jgi:hypothetical protein
MVTGKDDDPLQPRPVLSPKALVTTPLIGSGHLLVIYLPQQREIDKYDGEGHIVVDGIRSPSSRQPRQCVVYIDVT